MAVHPQAEIMFLIGVQCLLGLREYRCVFYVYMAMVETCQPQRTFGKLIELVPVDIGSAGRERLEPPGEPCLGLLCFIMIVQETLDGNAALGQKRKEAFLLVACMVGDIFADEVECLQPDAMLPCKCWFPFFNDLPCHGLNGHHTPQDALVAAVQRFDRPTEIGDVSKELHKILPFIE